MQCFTAYCKLSSFATQSGPLHYAQQLEVLYAVNSDVCVDTPKLEASQLVVVLQTGNVEWV